MGCFRTEAAERLTQSPLQQIWRDHLLVGALLNADPYDDGVFVFLYPKENARCVEAVAGYRRCLSDERTFMPWTLEDAIASLATLQLPWVQLVHDRYLAFDKLLLA